MILPLFVPRRPGLAGIAPGSAIVGRPPTQDGHIHCYYEGNLYGAENLRTYRERAYMAAARLRDRAATVAQVRLPSDDLTAVAGYDLDKLAIVEPTDLQALMDWSEEDEEALVGRVLPVGSVDRSDPRLARLLGDLRPVSRTTWRTTAGQILTLTRDGGLSISP